MDNGQLICLYLLARLLQRELEKCLRLVTFLPMQDMDKHFGLEEIIKMESQANSSIFQTARLVSREWEEVLELC